MGSVDMPEGRVDNDARADEHSHQEHASHHHHHHHHEEQMTQEEAVRSLLVLGQVALNAGDYGSAVEAYASVLKLEQNATASYYLGNLYARGLGVKRDYVEAARLLHQAETQGIERASRLCSRCMYDYLTTDLGAKKPSEVFASMAVFVTMVYPEATDQRAEVNNGLLAVANTLVSKGAYAEAAKVYSAAAEFGHDSRARDCLAVLREGGADL